MNAPLTYFECSDTFCRNPVPYPGWRVVTHVWGGWPTAIYCSLHMGKRPTERAEAGAKEERMSMRGYD